MATKFYKIPCYSMKCRLYPNKSQAQAIDNILHGIRLYYNGLLYDMFFNHNSVTEKQSKTEDRFLHWPDMKTAFSAAYKKTLTEKFPGIACVPAAAITTNVGLKSDVQREFSKNKNPLEFQKPRFYNDKHPRRSYTYQISYSQIEVSENPNVFFIWLENTGVAANGKLCRSRIKIRGVNNKIRFDEEGTIDFCEYIKRNRANKLTMTVIKDNCGDYFICFKLSDCVYKEFPRPEQEVCGVDVGIADLAIVSDGEKYGSKKYKKDEKRHIRWLNRRLSRRQGPSNIRYREERRKHDLEISKSYLLTQQKMAKLQRKIARKRELYQHEVSKKIVAAYGFIGIESLNVSGMMRNRRLAFALGDAGMAQFLGMLAYKSDWHGRVIQPIDKWTPSSRRCSSCKKYFKNDLKLSDRYWVCPVCGTRHDRDINAAINIKEYALETYKGMANA